MGATGSDRVALALLSSHANELIRPRSGRVPSIVRSRVTRSRSTMLLGSTMKPGETVLAAVAMMKGVLAAVRAPDRLKVNDPGVMS